MFTAAAALFAATIVAPLAHAGSQIDNYRIIYTKEVKDKNTFGEEITKKKEFKSDFVSKVFNKIVKVTKIKNNELFRYGMRSLSNNSNHGYYELLADYTSGFADTGTTKNILKNYYLELVLACDSASKTCSIASTGGKIRFVNDSIADDIKNKLKLFGAEISYGGVDVYAIVDGKPFKTPLVRVDISPVNIGLTEVEGDDFFGDKRKQLEEDINHYRSTLAAYQTEYPKIKTILPDSDYFYGDTKVQNLDEPIKKLRAVIAKAAEGKKAEEEQKTRTEIVFAYNMLKHALTNGEDCNTGHAYCRKIDDIATYVKGNLETIAKNKNTAAWVTAVMMTTALAGDVEGADKIIDEYKDKIVLAHPETRLFGPYHRISMQEVTYESFISYEFNSWYKDIMKTGAPPLKDAMAKYIASSRHFKDYYKDVSPQQQQVDRKTPYKKRKVERYL